MNQNKYKIAAKLASEAAQNVPYNKHREVYIKVYIETLKQLEKIE